MAPNHVTLDDKYDLTKSRIFVTGFQAIVRLCLMQKERDRLAGLNTAGYVTGYRGSPLGTLDLQFIRAQKSLDKYDIKFQSGINEDIAATALWGTQQAELRGEGKFDGVFGLWYGKGPGVDRTGDVFRHANFAGTSKHGGVLALMGDDHTAESSTTAHQSEYHFVDVMIPILNPAGVQEILDYGLYGWAMSRYCGTWVALKCDARDGRIDRRDRRQPGAGQHRHPDRLRDAGGRPQHPPARHHSGPGSTAARLQARCDAGLRARQQAQPLHHVGRPQPEDRHHHGRQEPISTSARRSTNSASTRSSATISASGSTRSAARGRSADRTSSEFAEGLELIIVVEEKRSLIEVQVREELYGTANQPVCIGKKDEQGNWLFPVKGALDPNDVAHLHRRADPAADRSERADRRRSRAPQGGAAGSGRDQGHRGAHAVFLLGLSAQHLDGGAGRHARLCRHRLPLHGAVDGPLDARLHPDGRRGRQLDRRGAVLASASTSSRISATAPTTIRATWRSARAIASGVNITYKILFNDAVAMTGGQANDGGLTVPQIARQVAAEGAKTIVVVTDEPWKYAKSEDWPKGLTIHHRDELNEVQTRASPTCRASPS